MMARVFSLMALATASSDSQALFQCAVPRNPIGRISGSCHQGQSQ